MKVFFNMGYKFMIPLLSLHDYLGLPVGALSGGGGTTGITFNNLVPRGYPSCAQSEISNFGTEVEKYVDAVLVDFVARDSTPTGQLRVQITTNNTPKCAQWKESDPVELSCLNEQADPDDDEENNLRSGELPSFLFYEAGVYAAYRFWLEGTPDQAGGDGPSSPIDCSSDFTTIRMRLRQRTQTWK